MTNENGGQHLLTDKGNNNKKSITDDRIGRHSRLVNFFSLAHDVIGFETNRLVKIKDFRVGILYRLLQMFVIFYIIGYQIFFLKGYQKTIYGTSSVTVKVLGNFAENKSDVEQIFDPQDYVISKEIDSFIILTHAILTQNQSRGLCPELPRFGLCTSDLNCSAGEWIYKGHGRLTGRCVEFRKGIRTCEVAAWCPVQDGNITVHDKVKSNTSEPWLFHTGEHGVLNATVYVKNFVYFEEYGVKRRNLIESVSKDMLSKCIHNPNSPVDRFCPIFRLGDMLRIAGLTDKDFPTLLETGAVFSLDILWDCDFDTAPENCVPSYDVDQVDRNESISPGWNFREGDYYYENGEERRRLLKIRGFLFNINVRAIGRKFSVSELVWKIGSGVAFFGLATMTCEFVLKHCLPGRKKYSIHKYDYFSGIMRNRSPGSKARRKNATKEIHRRRHTHNGRNKSKKVTRKSHLK